MNRTHRVAMASAIVGLLSVALLVGTPSATAAPPVRYLDVVFPQVTVSLNNVYGQAVNVNGQLQDLLIDIYTPTGDTATNRPMVMWVHGGGFTAGTKGDTAAWATDFAKRGYVAASISYRLRPGHYFEFSNPDDPEAQNAVRDAVSDGQAAVRYLHAHAAELGIDPTRIAMGGNSAGAVLSLGVGLMTPETGASGNPGHSSRICLAVPNAGAMVPQVVDARDTPAVFFHGQDDTRVPELYAKATEQAMQNAGLWTQFFSYPGVGHVVGSNTVIPALLPVLFDRVVNGTCPEQTHAPGSGFHPMRSSRLVDTRTTNAPLGPGETRDIQISGTLSVPAEASAVALNVTAVSPTSDSHLTVWPTLFTAPTASNLNLGAGRTVAQAVQVGIGAGGKVSVRNNSGTVHLVVDLAGWFGPTGDHFTNVTPERVYDSGAPGETKLGPAQTRVIDVAGAVGAPESATALVLNVTTTNASLDSHLTAWSGEPPRPTTSNLNFRAGYTIANLVTVQIAELAGGGRGTVSFFNNTGSTDIVVDVLGYYAAGPFPGATTFTPVYGTRIVDTRVGIGGSATAFGAELRVYVGSGQAGVPATGARAVVASVTLVQPSEATHLTINTTAANPAPTSTVNAPAGRTVPNLTIAPLDATGHFSILNNAGHAHVLVDIVGWYA